ncbi:MAG: hypothetical protein V3T84_11120 [Phycisphaerales bacterium]
MGRNNRAAWQGKTLAEWQNDIQLFCKGDDERRCKVTDSVETRAFKIKMNFRCLLARSAVQYFYDEVDEHHLEEIRKVKRTLDYCHEVLMLSYRQEVNLIKKALGQYQRNQDDQRRLAKQKAPMASAPDSMLRMMCSSFQSDILKSKIDRRSRTVSYDDLVAGEAELEKCAKEAEGFHSRYITIRTQ